MTETTIVKNIILKIGEVYPTQIRAWRNNTGAAKNENGRFVRYGLVGSADISGLMAPNGRRLEIEVKTPKGYATVKQKAFGAMINDMGGLWILARSFEDVQKELDEKGVELWNLR